MTALATILEPGLQTSVQDAGREGARHLGVPQSGAADRLSLALANAAVGNPWDAGALECALNGPRLRFEVDCAFALAGANMAATLNGEAVGLHARREARAGDALVLRAAKAGARAYVAFEGGVAGEDFMGSVSTYAPAGLGGVEGRALRAGDAVHSAGLKISASRPATKVIRPQFAHEWVLRATRGPEFDTFDPDSARAYFSQTFAADLRGDRMGLRLRGPELSARDGEAMKSSPVFPGTVQCPTDGTPFLLLADAQTVGGYARIAQIIDADLHLAGQIRPRDRVWFQETSAAEARDIAFKQRALIASFIPGFRFG